jgi:Fe-S-cluster containining protein
MTGRQTADDFFTEFDAAFYTDGYNIASKCLSGGLRKKNILEICKQLYHIIDQLNISFISQCSKKNLSVDCRKGCSWCCHQSVFVVPYEVFYIMHYIDIDPLPDMREGISQAAAGKNNRTGKMKMQQLLHYREACPLLDHSGQCIAYNARPMACRIYLSADVSTCRDDFENPDDLNHFPSLYEFPLRAGRMLNEGVCTYLNEKNIISFEWTLESSLHKIFEDKQAFRKWSEGVNLFKARDVGFEEFEYLQRFEIIRGGNHAR